IIWLRPLVDNCMHRLKKFVESNGVLLSKHISFRKVVVMQITEQSLRKHSSIWVYIMEGLSMSNFENIERSKLAAYIDHTYLKPDATAATIRTLCEEAVEYGFYSVC